MGKEHIGRRQYLFLLLAFICLISLEGCTHVKGVFWGNRELDDAKQLILKGDEQAAIAKYEDILKRFPEIGDQSLFRLGLFYARSDNRKADYQKSLGYFQRLSKDYPQSRFREETESLTQLILEIINRDQSIKMSERRTDMLEKKAANLEKKVHTLEMQIEKMKEIDKTVEAKKRRRIPRK